MHLWTLTPASTNSDQVVFYQHNGNITYYSPVTVEIGIKPALYLTETVKIKAGTGTSTDPYIIGLDF